MTFLNITAYHFCLRFFIYSTCTTLRTQLILLRKHATKRQNFEEIKRKGKRPPNKVLEQNFAPNRPFFFPFFRFVNVFAQPHKDQKQEDSIYRRRVANDWRWRPELPTSSLQCHSLHMDTPPKLPITQIIRVYDEPISGSGGIEKSHSCKWAKSHSCKWHEYNGMLYRTSNRVLNNGIKVIILICMDGTSQYHHHPISGIQ